ncbi:phage tail protein [Dyella flagellata]|uniref:Microcystin dependent protein n=1 Tax=Dyella flagellata TaxID=1867833 RepID=A0ABQ5X6Z6_9GAMM|nr:tail fiber protein [Dyella flagellata]GLQ86466.1 microcystin dependent protein [Dyella flagellata]
MTQPYIGEIQLFGFNFAPLNWAFCNGATLAISQNTTLFSLLGTFYGGNGQTTFQLPNLVTRGACNQGQGPGRTSRLMGETFGEAEVALLTNAMPSHNHGFQLFNQTDTTKRTAGPTTNSALQLPHQADPFPPQGTVPNGTFAPTMLGVTGQNIPHENRQPSLAINYCIALVGVFPQFS